MRESEDIMYPQHAGRIRVGLAALFVAGVLYVVNVALRGAFVSPSADPARFAASASSTTFVPAWLIAIVSGVLVLPGWLALYAYLAHSRAEGLAFVGMILSFAGQALLMPLYGFLALAAPTIARLYLQGQERVMEVAVSFFAGGLGGTILLLASVLGIVSAILFGIAIWRSGTLPKGSAIPLVAQSILLGFPVSFATELLGAALFALATGWIAWHAWKTVAHPGQTA